MTYRELLELYKTGRLDEERRRRVEEELEKQEAIGDYLFEAAGLPEPEDFPEEPAGEEDRFTREIRKTIRGTFLKLGLAVGAAVFVLVLAVIFVLPHGVDALYYDPTETVSGYFTEAPDQPVEQERINLDLSVWTELFLPGGYRNRAYAEPLGYGRYALTFPRTNTPDHRGNSVAGMLVRDRITLYDPNAFNRDYAVFTLPEDLEVHREIAFDRLEEQLEEGRPYVAYVTLGEVTDYESLYRWCVDRRLLDELWFKVHGESVSWWGGFGFYVNTVGGSGFRPVWDEEKYPGLVSDRSWAFEEAERKEHFLSLLAYTRDNPEFTAAMGNLIPEYREAIDRTAAYVEEEGLWLEGFSFVGTREEILALREEDSVGYVLAVPAY